MPYTKVKRGNGIIRPLPELCGQSKNKNMMARIRYVARLPHTHARKKRLAVLAREAERNAPRRKPAIPWRIHVIAKELALYYGWHVSTAQRKLRETRKALNKKRNRYLTVKEYCKYNEEDEDTLQDFLNMLAARPAKQLREKREKDKKEKEEDE